MQQVGYSVDDLISIRKKRFFFFFTKSFVFYRINKRCLRKCSCRLTIISFRLPNSRVYVRRTRPCRLECFRRSALKFRVASTIISRLAKCCSDKKQWICWKVTICCLVEIFAFENRFTTVEHVCVTALKKGDLTVHHLVEQYKKTTPSQLKFRESVICVLKIVQQPPYANSSPYMGNLCCSFINNMVLDHVGSRHRFERIIFHR